MPKPKETCLHADGLLTVPIILGQTNRLIDVMFWLPCAFQGKSDHHFSDVATFKATGPVFKVIRGLHLMLKPLQIQIGVYV